jgi:hypothetical protein
MQTRNTKKLLEAEGAGWARSRTKGTVNNPAVLDAPLGFALLRDRRVTMLQKTYALATGASIAAGMIMATAIVTRLVGMPGRPFSAVPDGIAVASGALLFGALLIKRLAPREMVSRVRCERYTIIPMRKRTTSDSGPLRKCTESDPLAALGYSYPGEKKQYAVIPRRAR